MKTRHVEGYTKLPHAGRAAFIRSLKAKKVSKREALAQTQTKFNASAKAFDSIWSN